MSAGAEAASRRLGRYHLGESLGGGPTGEVFRAKVYGVAGFERQFAVKRFHHELVEDAEVAARIATAARLYGSLEHPRVARLHEYAVAAGETFIATELVEGVDLARLMDGGLLPAGAAARLVVQMGRAVGYAHGRGLTHLGLCPTNLICNTAGEIKVTDFGFLAPRLKSKPAEDRSLAARIPYLAPEQLAGEPTSPATDVYQLGLVAYELWVGRKPFSGATPRDIAHRILNVPVPDPGLDKPFTKLLRRALARSPFERFPDAGAMADAVEAALRASPLPGDLRDAGEAVRQRLEALAGRSANEPSGAVSFPMPAPPAHSAASSAGALSKDLFVRHTMSGTGELRPPEINVRSTLAGLSSSPRPPSAPLGAAAMPKQTLLGQLPAIQPVLRDIASARTPAPVTEPASADPVDAELASADPVDAELASADPVDAASASADPVDAVPDTVEISKADLDAVLESAAPPTVKLTEPLSLSLDGGIDLGPAGADAKATARQFLGGAALVLEPARESAAPLPPVLPPPVLPPRADSRDHIARRFAQVETSEMRSDIVADLESDWTADRALFVPGTPPPVANPLPVSPDFDMPELDLEPEPELGGDDVPPPAEDFEPAADRIDPQPAPLMSPVAPIPIAMRQTERGMGAGPPPPVQPWMPAPGSTQAPGSTRLPSASQLPSASAPRGSSLPRWIIYASLFVAIATASFLFYSLFIEDSEPAAPTTNTPVVATATPKTAAAIDASAVKAASPPDSGPRQGVVDAGALAQVIPPAGRDAAVEGVATDSSELVIDSHPSGAKIYLDGTLVGRAPQTLDGSPDSHRLVLVLPGHKLYAGDVEGRGIFKIDLAPVSPPEGPGGIKVRCKSKNRYYVFVDGIDMGQLCPTERIGVEKGDHLVEVYDPVTDSRRSFNVKVKDTRLSVRVRVD